jgi:murein DD-endopeptidase MepM/ murein hydrolase activator NlpD
MDPMTPGTYTVTSPFGYRIHPITGQRIFHEGIDLGCELNSPIYAADSGTVLYAGPASGFGNWIVIDHNNGFLTVYGHMYNDGLLVSPGQQVTKGQKIALSGSNGRSTGVHLHFEINKGSLGNRVNPADYINF